MKNKSILRDIKDIDVDIFKAIAMRFKSMNLNVTPVQGRIIMGLYKNNGNVCQKELERFTNCNKSTLSVILNTMEKNDLIRRVDSKEDFRRKHIELTDKSLEVVNKLEKEFNYITKEVSKGISDEEYNSFVNVINKIRNNLERI